MLVVDDNKKTTATVPPFILSPGAVCLVVELEQSIPFRAIIPTKPRSRLKVNLMFDR